MKIATTLVSISLVLSCLFQTKPESEHVAHSDNVPRALEFIRSLHPELSGKNYTLSVVAYAPYDQRNNFPESFTLSIGEGPRFKSTQVGSSGTPEWLPGFYDRPPYPRQILIAGFGFDRDGQLLGFGASSSVTYPIQQPHSLSSSLNDEQALDELKREGARFTPDKKDELLKNIPRALLTKFVGPFKVMTTDFISSGVGNEITIAGFWSVTVSANFGNKKPRTYTLFLDEFEGRLMDVLLEDTDKQTE